MAKEYIERNEAIKELRDVYEQDYPTASGAFDKYATMLVPRVLKNLPTVDVIEVEKIKEARKEILVRMNELMAEYMKHAMGADYFAGKSESMETAIRLVRAVFADLLDETKKEGTKE